MTLPRNPDAILAQSTIVSRASMPPSCLDLAGPCFQLQSEGSLSLEDLIISPPPCEKHLKSFPLPQGDNPNSLTLLSGHSGLAPADLSLLIFYGSCCHTLCSGNLEIFSVLTHTVFTKGIPLRRRNEVEVVLEMIIYPVLYSSGSHWESS